ncbi:MAG: 3'-5' exoribonuclease [Spirochaetes bacterium]|nr:3'-5' exoribonuclease [Spirochaetota bacterium]
MEDLHYIDAKLKDAVFCAIDLETTGINPFTEKIIEVGAVKFNIDGPIDTFESMIDPCMPIPEESRRIHGISNEMVSGCSKIPDIVDKFNSFLSDSILVIQNPSFDLSFLEMEYRRCGKRFRFMCAYDTVSLSRRAFPGLDNYKLDTVCAHLGIDLTHHRAYSDANACMSVFLRAIQKDKNYRKWYIDDLEYYAGPSYRDALIKELRSKKCRGSTIIPGREFMIDYIDSTGNETRRKISAKGIFQRGKQTIIHAHCHLRHEERFFISSRIKMAYSL